MRENVADSKIEKEKMVKISQDQPNIEPRETTPQVLESNFSVEVSTETQNKIVRLLLILKSSVLRRHSCRNFRTAMIPPSRWLADYPRDLENLYIRSADTGKKLMMDNLILGYEFKKT